MMKCLAFIEILAERLNWRLRRNLRLRRGSFRQCEAEYAALTGLAIHPDTAAVCRAFKILNTIDEYTRESFAKISLD